MNDSLKAHWDHIYSTRGPEEVSWTEQVPKTSLAFIHQFAVPKNAAIIDIGGGDSKLADHLLAEGFTDITVLDISDAAIQRAKNRLGTAATKVHWIVSDILAFVPARQYDLWHDRAAFHFQTDPEKIEEYLQLVKKTVSGMVIIGAFSTDGPKKCSGLDVQQYDEASMKAALEKASFKNAECKREDHITPAGAVQHFIFCSFIKQPG